MTIVLPLSSNTVIITGFALPNDRFSSILIVGILRDIRLHFEGVCNIRLVKTNPFRTSTLINRKTIVTRLITSPN